MVNSGQVVTTSVPGTMMSAPMITTDAHAQVLREPKIAPQALVTDWDDNSQSEQVHIAVPTSVPGSGPSRPDFF